MTTREDDSMTEARYQIVTFELRGEAYCVDLDIVQEVIRLSGISKVPQALDFIDGVINLRGFVIPVVDLAARFGLGQVSPKKSARIMIIDIEDQVLGVKVDRVLEVTEISEGEVEPPSNLLRSSIKSEYLQGFVEIKEMLVKVLDFERIFSGAELESLRDVEEREIKRTETEV